MEWIIIFLIIAFVLYGWSYRDKKKNKDSDW
ncbi:MAG TPA: FeoB-associated Cys-rich membrane protein [Puia sp.]|nr:FeoB-associated Cys-rich membrane protein [Puia sp.]